MTSLSTASRTQSLTISLRSNSASSSRLSFSDSPSIVSRSTDTAGRRVSSISHSYSSGYQSEDSLSSLGIESAGAASSRWTRTSTIDSSHRSYTPSSSSDSLSRSVAYSTGYSYLNERSRTPTQRYTEGGRSRIGSHRGNGTHSSGSGWSRSGTGSRNGSGSSSDNYTPDTYTARGGFPSDRDLHSRSSGIRGSGGMVNDSVGDGEHMLPSSSGTGYEICSSSDFTGLSLSSTQSIIFRPKSLTPVISDDLSDATSERYITASAVSTDYEEAARESVISFKPLPAVSDAVPASSISTYRTASEPSTRSDYRTASGPSEPSPGSLYATAGDPDLEENQSESQLSTSTLSSLRLFSEPEKVVHVPLASPSTRSPPESIVSELQPAEIPLPPSTQVSIEPSPSSTPVSSLRSSSSRLPNQSRRPSIAAVPRILPDPLPPPSSSPLSKSPGRQYRPVSTPSLGKSPSLPPLPSSAGTSPSPSLSATPSVSEPSAAEERDVSTPSSLHVVQGEDSEGTSLLSSLPLPTPRLRSTSLAVPTTPIFSPISTVSLPQPSPQPFTQSVPQSSASSLSDSTSTTSLTPSTLSSTSQALSSPQQWAAVTDVSYASSLLLPSPSIHSIALREDTDVSFDTLALRPSRSSSYVSRVRTSPPFHVARTAIPPPHSPSSSLTPVPALSLSLSTPMDARTPTGITFTSESSSSEKVSTLVSSSSSSSNLTPSTINPTLLESRSEALERDDDPAQIIPEPSTEPSLLTTPRSSPNHISSPLSSDVPSLRTPPGTIIVSITTPHGSGSTERSSLRTASPAREKDLHLGSEFDRFADEVRAYDQMRGLVHQALVHDVKTLTEEVKILARYVRRKAKEPLAAQY